MVAESELVSGTSALFVALHVSAAPVVSLVSEMAGRHPGVELSPDSGSATDQCTMTLLVYQPLVPWEPSMLREMSGGVESGTPAAEGTSSKAARRRGRQTTRRGRVISGPRLGDLRAGGAAHQSPEEVRASEDEERQGERSEKKWDRVPRFSHCRWLGSRRPGG
jgi:hypothetical protein